MPLNASWSKWLGASKATGAHSEISPKVPPNCWKIAIFPASVQML